MVGVTSTYVDTNATTTSMVIASGSCDSESNKNNVVALTKEEVSKKKYVIFEGAVYDIQSYLPSHPGGEKILRSTLGGDITEEFYGVGHSKNAVQLLQKMYMADVAGADEESGAGKKRGRKDNLWTRALQLKEAKLLNSSEGASCWEYKFTWNDDGGRLPQLAPGGHIKLYVEEQQEGEGEQEPCSCARSYTPVSFDSNSRTMTLAIKLYEHGEMSNLLRKANSSDASKLNLQSYEMSGPFGEITYQKEKQCIDVLSSSSLSYSCRENLIFIAGGTGMTPFMSVLRALKLGKKNDGAAVGPALSKKITMVYCSKTEEEVMYRMEIESLLAENNGVLHIIAPSARDTLSDEIVSILSPSPSSSSSATTGNDTCCIVCGPPAMEEAIQPILSRLGYKQVLTSTTLANTSSVISVSEHEQETKFSYKQLLMKNGNFNVVLFGFALLLPLAAIAMNGGVPSSWPHYEVFPPNPVGFGGKFNIVGFGETNENGEKVSRYAYRLSAPTALQYASPWIGYAIHQVATIWVLYRAFKQQPKYSMQFRDFNWQMLWVQIIGVLLKYIQQVLFYNGLSETLPLGFGTGTVFLYLIVVMIMYIPVRGLFFGNGANWNWTKSCTDFFRLYHGFFIGIFIINDFWYHPFESTVGHLTGILNDAMLLAQMVIIYMPFHLNKYWCLAMETFVMFHAALIALNRDTPGAVGAFGFAYFFIFVLTQMHGVGWSRLFRSFLALVFVTSILLVYGLRLQGEDKGFKAMVLEVFLRIPILEYLTIFFVIGFFVASKRLVNCFSNAVFRKVVMFSLILIGTAICFMPLIAIFL